VAPSANPDIVQENQPNGVDSPAGVPSGVESCEKFENVPALVDTTTVPSIVTTLQVAPLQLVVAGAVMLGEALHAVSSSRPTSATPPIRRSTLARIGIRPRRSSDRRPRRLFIRAPRLRAIRDH